MSTFLLLLWIFNNAQKSLRSIALKKNFQIKCELLLLVSGVVFYKKLGLISTCVRHKSRIQLGIATLLRAGN